MDVLYKRDSLGINLYVGRSSVSPQAGRGLFVQLQSHISECILNQGTILCTYPHGKFVENVTGDKTVAFYYYSTNIGVIFQDKFMRLFDAIGYMAEKNDNLSNALFGHKIYYDANENDIIIVPDNFYHYQPYDINNNEIPKIENFGVYINDLAYTSDINENIYNQIHPYKNCLQIVWKIEYDENTNTLIPIAPVIIMRQTMKFTNKIPLELGVSYSYKFWEVHRYNSKKE